MNTLALLLLLTFTWQEKAAAAGPTKSPSSTAPPTTSPASPYKVVCTSTEVATLTLTDNSYKADFPPGCHATGPPYTLDTSCLGGTIFIYKQPISATKVIGGDGTIALTITCVVPVDGVTATPVIQVKMAASVSPTVESHPFTAVTMTLSTTDPSTTTTVATQATLGEHLYLVISSEAKASEFHYSSPFEATDEMKRGFDEKGHVIIRGLLEPDELQKVTRAFEDSEYIKSNAYSTSDGTGRKSRVACWKQPGDDVTGLVTRSERVVRTCEKLLGGEVYHYHSKINMKEAKTGGQFVWHQDYGYWYQNGILFPDMISVFIALDASVKENGCLQILESSHKCGRIDHGRVAGQTGADLARVEQIKDALPLKYVELQPGDAVFFHCNVLHTSSANVSDRRRWVFISCFNRVSNKATTQHHFPSSGKLDIVCDSAIRNCANLTDMSAKDFLDPKDNVLISAAL